MGHAMNSEQASHDRRAALSAECERVRSMLHGDGIHDDTEAVKLAIQKGVPLDPGTYLVRGVGSVGPPRPVCIDCGCPQPRSYDHHKTCDCTTCDVPG